MTASSHVKSADRTLSILSLLAARSRPASTMEIASCCGIPKSSTHHLLNVLRRHRYVTYLEGERMWQLGYAAYELGVAYERENPVHRHAPRFLRNLAEASGSASHLAVLHGTDAFYVDKREPARPLPTLVTRVGSRLPAHLSAVGLALLSDLAEDQLREIYRDYSFPRLTEAGPVGVESLLQRVRRVRAAGYAHDRGQVTRGISCVAAPVPAARSAPVAAVGITFVTGQHRDAELAKIINSVRAVGRALSEVFAGAGATAIPATETPPKPG